MTDHEIVTHLPVVPVREKRQKREKGQNDDSAGAFRAFSAYRAGEWNPPTLEPEARQGLAGLWAEAMEPFTEASSVGVLVSTLIGFGSAVGRSPYVQVGATRHHAHDFAALVGPTATGRKGDAMKLGLRPIQHADADWALRVVRGFGSGEALIEEVADPDPGDESAEGAKSLSVDKRICIYEDELAHPLAVAAREGSTLSQNLRSAWDGSRMENRTRGRRKLIATDAHVSALAAITPQELLRRCSETEIANGFLNRFLLVAVKRSQILPNPRPIPGDIELEYVTAIQEALEAARRTTEMRRDNEAAEVWAFAYENELSVDRYGLAGSACSRAEAHTLRLSMLYALIDSSSVIRAQHVKSALAVWRYCEQSAYIVFGDRLGDADADTILDALLDAGDKGMTRSKIRDLFSRHRAAAEMDNTIGRLVEMGLVVDELQPTLGRSATRYWHSDFSTGHAT